MNDFAILTHRGYAMINHTKEELLKSTNETYRELEQKIGSPNDRVNKTCKVLELAVNLFYLTKYGALTDRDLYNDLNDERFSSCFNRITLSDMYAIRTTRNDVMHGTLTVTEGDANELFARLKLCLGKIEKVIPMKIIDKSSDPEIQVLHEGDSFSVSTRVPKDARIHFSKAVFGFDFDGKASVWQYDAEHITWMVSFDKKERKGWKNAFLSDDELYQENVYHKRLYSNDMHYKRLVFDMQESPSETLFVFRGIFVYEPEKSDLRGKMYFKKVASEFDYQKKD